MVLFHSSTALFTMVLLGLYPAQGSDFLRLDELSSAIECYATRAAQRHAESAAQGHAGAHDECDPAAGEFWDGSHCVPCIDGHHEVIDCGLSGREQAGLCGGGVRPVSPCPVSILSCHRVLSHFGFLDSPNVLHVRFLDSAMLDLRSVTVGSTPQSMSQCV